MITEQIPATEYSFWLGIMRDHARFILDNLAPAERDFGHKVFR